MRDPKRIKEFCEQLAAIWERVPDWRFGQFVSNVLGQVQTEKKRDIFFIEDDEMLTEYSTLLNRLAGMADEMSSYFRKLKQMREEE